MNESKQKLPQVVRVLLVTAFVTALIVGFGEYIFWTKPLANELTKTKKEANALDEQLQAVTKAASQKFLTYTNSNVGFSFQYPEDYEVVAAPDGAEIPTGSFAYLRKKDGNSAVMWIGIRDSRDALVPETQFQDKVVKSETTLGSEKISATSLSLLPGRGDEFGSSLHILHLVVPLKSNATKSLVLTNIGDTDLIAFQLAVQTFSFK